ncbi:uncharacterized protein LOC114515787 [Dendronephthya gigantea]|uniref:uncharacterized protein LOC114515787 n=1 Tax=Dendronephthya gigantea TaxID=151771 RepID=UPI001069D548|nr:uncharacterized protein LOC114515787 [Dendronephthya gigantea]
MDVKKGHCWRCERATRDFFEECSQCKIANYCSKKCLKDDRYRHNPECEVWRPKECNNPGCFVKEGLKECSGCSDAWYCGKSCQANDRSSHKKLCQKLVKNVKDAAAKQRDYFKKRSGGPIARPYYVGNTLAIDMLNLQENECDVKLDKSKQAINLKSDFRILHAGCGNLRHTILTTASLPEDFKGKISMTLNDFDPFVQARNVLFLCMMVVFAAKPGIAELITTFWYSLHLSSSQFDFLIECLTKLAGFNSAALASVTKGLLNISDDHMAQIREVWRGWLSLQCEKSSPKYINLKMTRDVFRNAMNRDPKQNFNKWAFLLKRQAPEECVKSLEKWLEDENFQASSETLRYDNPTLTGFNIFDGKDYTLTEALETLKFPRRHEFVYCVSGKLSVFGEWDQLLVQKHNLNKSLVLRFHSYITSLIEKTISLFKDKRLSIDVHVCNYMEIPSLLPSDAQFDRIFTSNIADFHGTKTVLKTFKPLLKTSNKKAVLVTQYQTWHFALDEAVVERNLKLPIDGTYNQLLLAARNDTGRKDVDEMLKSYSKVKGNSMFCMMDEASAVDTQSMVDAMSRIGIDEYLTQEYFNNMVYFVTYLRADLMACDPCLPGEKVVSFQDVTSTEGFRMRDFRRELNSVVPFSYRRNARPVNLLKALQRMVEWRLPDD